MFRFPKRYCRRATRNRTVIRAQMTAQQAEAFAAFLVTLRPGQRSWTRVAVVDALTNAAATISNDVRVMTRAAVEVALDPKVATPQIIGMSGVHWERAT